MLPYYYQYADSHVVYYNSKEGDVSIRNITVLIMNSMIAL